VATAAEQQHALRALAQGGIAGSACYDSTANCGDNREGAARGEPCRWQQAVSQKDKNKIKEGKLHAHQWSEKVSYMGGRAGVAQAVPVQVASCAGHFCAHKCCTRRQLNGGW